MVKRKRQRPGEGRPDAPSILGLVGLLSLSSIEPVVAGGVDQEREGAMTMSTRRRRMNTGRTTDFVSYTNNRLLAGNSEDTSADDGSTSSSSTKSTTQGISLLDVESFCPRQKDIQVTALSLTCDSPGTYYYSGSNSNYMYRNSPICRSNDTANLKMQCKSPE